MKKGEITVFLSIVFVLLLSFTAGILEASIVQTSKNKARLIMDRAIFSSFGEYNRELLEKYHVFALEGSYGTGRYEEADLLKRLHYYGSSDINSQISDIQYLTDQGAQGYREQILAYMEQKSGLSFVEELVGIGAQWEEQEMQGKELQEKGNQLLEQFHSALNNYEANVGANGEIGTTGGSDSLELGEVGELFDFLDTMKRDGILSLVLPRDMHLSQKTIDLSRQVSNRGKRTGRGSFYGRANMNGLKERLLIDEYAMKNFDCAVSEDDSESREEHSGQEKTLSYEVEYILSGKRSDKSNLESVLMKIFLVRLPANYVYLFSDSTKVSEARTLAMALALLLLSPGLVEAFCQLILLAWAAGESLIDLRILMSGKQAAFFKSAETWKLSLSSLFTLGTTSNRYDGSNVPGGVSYQNYLQVFLIFKSTEDVAMKMLDRIEENINSSAENPYFKADQCVTKIRLNSKVQIFGAISYQFPVYFGYE